MANPFVIQESDGSSRYIRDTFEGMGQNSFWQPPTQPQDSFQALTNVLPSVDGTLNRRWGYDLFNSTAGSAVKRMYEYQKDSDGSRRIIFTTNVATITAINESGTAYNSSIFTTTAGAGIPRCVVSRDYAYFVDGVQDDEKKWDGSATGGVSKWGIGGPAITSKTVGPYLSLALAGFSTGSEGSTGKFAGTAAIDIGFGARAWTNPSNATAASNSTYATVACTNSNLTDAQILKLTNFGFTIPTNATILGIKVILYGHWVASGGNIATGVYALYKNNVLVGTGPTVNGSLPLTTDGNAESGGSAELWGTNWTPADINRSDFGVAVVASAAGTVLRRQ